MPSGYKENMPPYFEKHHCNQSDMRQPENTSNFQKKGSFKSLYGILHKLADTEEMN